MAGSSYKLTLYPYDEQEGTQRHSSFIMNLHENDR